MTPGMSMGHASGPHVTGLLPAWMAVSVALMFAAIALSHLRHLLATSGERVAWHLCHVLTAIGMAVMYLSLVLHLSGAGSGAWRVVFVVAGPAAARP